MNITNTSVSGYIPAGDTDLKDIPRTVKDKTLKTYYHTFTYKDKDVEREITLCVISESMTYMYCERSEIEISIGYSVKLPSCTPKESLAKSISKGRAIKCPLDVIHLATPYSRSCELYKDKGILQAIARNWERRLHKNVHEYIKGIR